MKQKPEGYTEDQLPPGKDNRITNLLLHQSLPDLIRAIKDYLENYNQNPQVFVWSAPVERILEKYAKCKEVLDSPHYFRRGA
jgi:hypothetical protein